MNAPPIKAPCLAHRVTTLEDAPDDTGVPQEVTDDITGLKDGVSDLEGNVTGLGTDVTGLGVRVTTLEGNWPPADHNIVIDDKATAGFAEAVPVANVEEGLAYINTRLGAQSTRIDTVESAVGNLSTSLNSNLSGTVSTVISEMISNNTFTIPANEDFNPIGRDLVEPDEDALDGNKQFFEARAFSEAVLALRWASQLKYEPLPTDSLLGPANADRVRGALDVLDKAQYDVINGNIAIDLHSDTTVNGSPLNEYIATTILGDTVLLGSLFSSAEFTGAITNEVTNLFAGGNVAAGDVSVDNTNVGANGYDDVQQSVESLYATASGNGSAIASLEAAALANASGVSFDNAAHSAFGNNNTTTDVQAAVDDVHEIIQGLIADIAAIGAGGVSTTAANVTYGNNGQATVAAALDDLYLSITNITVQANGTYISQGQDLAVAVAALDAALANVENNVLTDHEDRLVVLENTDAANRLTALEAQADANTDALTGIADNTTVEAVAADLATLDGALDERINALVGARVAQLIADRIQPLEDGLADLQDNAANAAFILGVSADSTTGRINFGGQQGMRGATAMCQASFNADGNGNGDATAHFCSNAEVQTALSTGGYDAATANFDNVETWTVSGLTVRHGTANVYTGAADSLAASCNNLSYQSGDVATGVSLRVDLDSAGFGGGGAGAVSDVFILRPARGCASSFPVLCCR
ncbi:MAG: hypothetical protein GY822_11875 [Deltaproteobacteria bacterium]|nr:hypothetical protein [Deltaproteobacteria bacterium]